MPRRAKLPVMAKAPLTTPAALTALCSAIDFADTGEGAIPEWVHLLPAGRGAAGSIETGDARGPYFAPDLHAVAARFAPGDKLPIDECHAADLAAPEGRPAPARGWIVALQVRQDGLWGQVEWTGAGKALMADKAYRGISPVILHDKAKKVLAVLRASLINTPNLKGLVALHSEEGPSENIDMDLKGLLVALMGLASDADDAAVFAAVEAKVKGAAGSDGAAVALQAVLAHPQYVALQGELTAAQGKLAELEAAGRKAAAEAFVDGAIADMRVGVKPQRDTYISMHMENAERTEALVGSLPRVNGDAIVTEAPQGEQQGGLSAADRQVIALMGLSEEDYTASLKAVGQKKEAL